MSSYLYGLGRWCFRNRGRALAAWLAAMIVLGGVAAVIHGKFSDEFEIPGARSQEALTQLYQTFPEVAGTRASMLVVAAPGQSVDAPELREPLEKGLKDLDAAHPWVGTATSPFDPMVKGMINPDRTAAMANVMLDVASTDVTDAQRATLTKAAADIEKTLPSGTKVSMGGDAFSVEIPKMTATEGLGVIVAFIVLIVTLGSVVAAGMPLITAIWGVGVSVAIMFGATGLASISSTTPMLAVMLGLAVGIDYALFILSRHREQLSHGMEVEESTARAVATAGSAVIFAGLTVIIALMGLGLANIPFLTVMGVFASVAVAFAVVIALTLLPALMGFAGEKLRPKKAPKPGEEYTAEQEAAVRAKAARGPSGRWVRIVTKVPALTIALVVLGLGALAIPATDLRLSLPNSGQHTAGAPDRVTYDLIAEKFGPGYNGPLIVTAEIIGSNDPLKLMDDLKKEVEKVPGVQSVPMSTPNRNADTGFMQVVPTTAPDDERTKELVAALIARAPEWKDRYGVDTNVTGMTAVQIDISDQLARALIPFGIFVVGLSLVLLTMVFRSIAVPIKATVGYLLSVAASFGATALVFTHGWFNDLVHLEKPMAVISFYPILLMGILFGLAMDYEVFLVSRMREEYVHGASAKEAVHRGFIGSAPVVVAAALIMIAVFAFFVPEGQGPIKAIAFGLAVGVAVDAFIVRMTLVPAVLALLGDKAWWLPKWLDRRLPSFDVEGEALAHMLDLRDWPAPDDPHVVAVEDFGVRAHPTHDNPSGDLTAPVDIRLLPGDVLVVEGPVVRRTPLLLGLAGRLTGTTGKAKIAGQVLPEQAASVRGRVALVDCLHRDGVEAHASIREELDRALSDPRIDLVVIDGADAVPSHDERAAIAELAHAVRQPPEGVTPPAVVLGVGEAHVVADLLPAGAYELHVGEPRPTPQPDRHHDHDLVTTSNHLSQEL
ncbi:MMPL family transporter [Mariniluteicoccus flavus]